GRMAFVLPPMLAKPAPASTAAGLLVRGNKGRCGLPRLRQQVHDHVPTLPLEQVQVPELCGNMNGEELALDRCQGADRVGILTILHGISESVASIVLIEEDEIGQRTVFSVVSHHGALERLHGLLEPALAAVVALAKRLA